MIFKDRLKRKNVSQTIVKPLTIEDLFRSPAALSASKFIDRPTDAKNENVVQIKNRFSALNQKPISESVLNQKTAYLTKKTFKKGHNLHRSPEIYQISNLLENTLFHYYKNRSVGD